MYQKKMQIIHEEENPMSKGKPSFFKVLSNLDFNTLLRLPPTFMRRYHYLNLPANVKLRVHSRRRWNVKVERMDNGLFCFTQGWQNFAKDAALQLGEFLVFSLTKQSEFNVVIYETSFCERMIPLTCPQLLEQNPRGSNVKKRAKAHNGVGVSRRNCFLKKGNPLYFATRLKPHHMSRISLPNQFAKAARVKSKEHVRMQYAGNQHSTSVVVDPRPQYRTDLARGWREFRVKNRLVYGNIYSFEFNPDHDVIHVNQVKNMSQN